MHMLKTVWEYSLKTEAERLLHTAHQIAVGFYKVNNFVVLPYGPDYKNNSIITFPNLPYHKISRFWEKVKKVNVDQIPVVSPNGLVEETIKLLKEASLKEPDINEARKIWGKAQNELIDKIYEVIPSKKNAISGIVIYPTKFGTNTSFNRPYKYPASIQMYLREGENIYTIAEAILTSLTRHDVYERLGGVWQESELLVDWLVEFSSIAEILKKYDPKGFHHATIKYTRIKQRAGLTQKSKEFYKSLGISYMERVFDLKNDELVIQGSSLANLSNREKEILTLMIRRGSKLTTIDELAEILFKGDEDTFSLQAIAKTIQRLRDKLESNGISGSFIQTKRGEGYLLVN